MGRRGGRVVQEGRWKDKNGRWKEMGVKRMKGKRRGLRKMQNNRETEDIKEESLITHSSTMRLPKRQTQRQSRKRRPTASDTPFVRNEQGGAHFNQQLSLN